MAVVQLLEEVKEWLDSEVCKNFEFKKPPETGSVDGDNYEYERVTPESYLMYPPLNGKFPSVTIQFGEGTRDVNKQSGELNLRFLFATWSPGTHYIDEETGKRRLEITNEGWRDVWNFIDYTLRKLSNTCRLGPNIRIKHEKAITFGPTAEQDVNVNYYPHWCGWIAFTIQYGVNGTNEDYSDLI